LGDSSIRTPPWICLPAESSADVQGLQERRTRASPWDNVRMLRLLLLPVFCLWCLAADNMPSEADQRLAREIYKAMIESRPGFPTGAPTPIAEAVAARLKAAGFPAADIFVGGAIPRKANVVVRYRGTGPRKPILLLAHIDVVEALREDWTMDPFTFIEK